MTVSDSLLKIFLRRISRVNLPKVAPILAATAKFRSVCILTSASPNVPTKTIPLVQSAMSVILQTIMVAKTSITVKTSILLSTTILILAKVRLIVPGKLGQEITKLESAKASHLEPSFVSKRKQEISFTGFSRMEETRLLILSVLMICQTRLVKYWIMSIPTKTKIIAMAGFNVSTPALVTQMPPL